MSDLVEFKNAVKAAGLNPDEMYATEMFVPSFWRKSQSEDFDTALKEGAVYPGEPCAGYTCYADSMTNARVAATCIDSSSIENDLTVRLVIDGVLIGDLDIRRCF
jgi:hypothetical protein